MTTIGRLAASVCLIMFLLPGPGVAQQVTFRPNPNAPLQPNARSDGEFDAFLRVQDERDPRRMVRLATEFLSTYDASEFQNYVLRFRFQGRMAQDDKDWEEIIQSAQDGLTAEELFRNGKLGFIEDPEALEEWPAFQLDQANQRMIYYSALTTGYQELGNSEEALRYAELALDAQNEVWDLFSAQNDPSTPEYQEAQARTEANGESLLRTMLAIHRADRDEAAVLETSRRLLEVRPGDLELLMLVSSMMSQNVPQDPDAASEHLAAAEDYAQRAVDALEAWIDSPASVQVNARVKRDYLVEAHSNLGMVRFQTADYAGAAEAFKDAVDVVPDDPILHYRLGVAYNNSQNPDEAVASLARAVFLGFSDARPNLETAYQAKNGSLEGLDEFIEAQGAELGR